MLAAEPYILATIPVLLMGMGYILNGKLKKLVDDQAVIRKAMESHVRRVEDHCPIYQHNIARIRNKY